jgi:HEAT repeat protein
MPQRTEDVRELLDLAGEILAHDHGHVQRALRTLAERFGAAPSGASAAGKVSEHLSAVNMAELSRLDSTVREFSGYRAPEEWIQARSRWVDRFVSMPDGWAILALLSFHRDGHVRQAAIQALRSTRNVAALPFAVLRLNDWVREVRRSARETALGLLVPENSEEIVRALPLILALRGRSRDEHGPVVDAALAVLRLPQCRDSLRRGIESSDPHVRAACYRLLLDESGTDAAVWKRALADAAPRVRLWAFRALAALDAPPIAVIEQARTDPFAPIRREAFRFLVAAVPQQADQEIERALMDRNGTLRWEAARLLWDRSRRRASETYRRVLAEETGRRQVIAALGLAEHGSEADVPLLLPMLTSARVSLRAAAVEAVGKLAAGGRDGEMMRALADSSPSVSAAAMRALVRRTTPDLVPQLEEMAQRIAHPFHVRRNALHVLATAGKWHAIPGLVRACTSASEEVASVAVDLVRAWLAAYNHSFVQPTEAQVADLVGAVTAPALGGRAEQALWREMEAVARVFRT